VDSFFLPPLPFFFFNFPFSLAEEGTQRGHYGVRRGLPFPEPFPSCSGRLAEEIRDFYLATPSLFFFPFFFSFLNFFFLFFCACRFRSTTQWSEIGDTGLFLALVPFLFFPFVVFFSLSSRNGGPPAQLPGKDSRKQPGFPPLSPFFFFLYPSPPPSPFVDPPGGKWR